MSQILFYEQRVGKAVPGQAILKTNRRGIQDARPAFRQLPRTLALS
jgi:hypothetical protein